MTESNTRPQSFERWITLSWTMQLFFSNIYPLDSGAIQRLKDQMTLLVRYWGILNGQERSVHIRTYARAYIYRLKLEKKILLSEKRIFLIIKSGWLKIFSHFIDVFVLAFPLSFYYSVILIASLGFFRKNCTLSTTLARSEKKQLTTAFSCLFISLKISCGKRWKWHFPI